MFKKTLSLKHKFEKFEISDIAKTLTESLFHKDKAEANKKVITRQANDEIKYWHLQIEQQRNLINDGYEYRDVACFISYNDPEPGQKTIRRTDNQESWQEPMTIDEYNLFNNANVPTQEEE